jgi:hypothetical protein
VGPDEFKARLDAALVSYDATSPRSLQTELGFSDLACPERARRRLAGVPPSSEPSRWAAQVGSAIHIYVARAAAVGFRNAVVEPELPCLLPSGITVVGHPDLILKDEPSCNDCKTVNGPGALALKARHGPEEKEIEQVSLGYEAGMQNELIDTAGGIVRLFWRDRSGESDETVVWQERFDYAWVEKADTFYTDARYAATHNEEARKEPHWSWCRQFCEHFGDCRGDAVFGNELTDPELLRTVEEHFEAKREKKYWTDLYDALRDVLVERLDPKTPGDDMRTYGAGHLRTRKSWINGSAGKRGSWRVETDEREEASI